MLTGKSLKVWQPRRLVLLIEFRTEQGELSTKLTCVAVRRLARQSIQSQKSLLNIRHFHQFSSESHHLARFLFYDGE